MTNTRTDYRLTMQYPASWWGAQWREAMPLGNGAVGAAVYGGVAAERILLTHEDLWALPKAAGLPDIAHMLSPRALELAAQAQETTQLPDISANLPHLRELLRTNRFDEAEALYRDALITSGYRPALEVPYPLGDLRIHMTARRGFEAYRRELSLSTGEACVRWRDAGRNFCRSQFVSRTHGWFVCKIEADGVGEVDARIGLEIHDPRDRQTFRPPMADLPVRVQRHSRGEWLFYAASRPEGGEDFGAVARVLHAGGAMSTAGSEITVSGADSVTVLVAVFASGERHAAWQALEAELANANDDYDTLFVSHEEAYRALFDRVALDIGATAAERELSNEELLLQAYQGKAPLALIEKLWAFGRYLLIASAHGGGQPSPLIGLWCGEYRGFWAFNMVNENLQLQYWQALSGNLPELLLPVFDYFEAKLKDFRTNAQHLYGCRGIYVPAATTPASGLLKMVVPHIVYWTGGAGWVGQLYYEYFLHTGDVDFLRTRALPWLREVALFYEDFFTVDEDGFYVSSPSNSPENPPGNRWDGRALCPDNETTVNATMDFAIAREVLTHLIEGSQLAGGVPAADIGHWRAMLSKLPPYQINERGGIREWMDERFADNERHRHLSHLYPLFPGLEVRRGHPQFTAFATGLEHRHELSLAQLSNWSLPHQACAFARTGDGNKALRCLDLLTRGFLLNNFYTAANDWRDMGIGNDLAWSPVQLDGNMGLSAAVQEMLLTSYADCLCLLPALPQRWQRGAVRGLVTRCGAVSVDLQWQPESLEVTLHNHGSVPVSLRVLVPEAFRPADTAEQYAITVQPERMRTLVFSAMVELEKCLI